MSRSGFSAKTLSVHPASRTHDRSACRSAGTACAAWARSRPAPDLGGQIDHRVGQVACAVQTFQGHVVQRPLPQGFLHDEDVAVIGGAVVQDARDRVAECCELPLEGGLRGE